MKAEDGRSPTCGIVPWLRLLPGTRWAWLGVLLLSLAHQAVADIGEVEPNNNRRDADVIPLDGSYQSRVSVARIASLSDFDYFKITTPSLSGALTLTVTMTPTAGDGSLDAKVELEDAAGSLTSRGNVLGSKNSPIDNVPETMSVAVSGSTTYYIRCTSADLFSSGSGQYTLSVRITVPQVIISAYWLAPNYVIEGTVATMRAQVSGFSVGDQFSFEIREDDGLLGSDQVTTRTGTVQTNDGKLYVEATWPTVWQPDLTGDPEFFFIVSRGAVARQSSDADADLMHVAIGDRNDQIGEAVAVGAMTQTRSEAGEIDSPIDADLFSFTVAAGQRISFDVDRPTGALAAYLRIFDASGNELARNTGTAGPGESPASEAYLEFTFPSAGTFYVGVSGLGNNSYNAVSGGGDGGGSTGAYTLVLSPGIAGTIQRPGDTTRYQVDILRYGSDPAPINPNLRTWIVIHGWRSSRENSNIAKVAASLAAARPGDQVLTLDWRAADTSVIDPFDAEDSIIPVAQWAAIALANYGINGSHLNLVGHSFGSYVADELAERLGGVNTIVALDAAADIAGGYDSEEPGQVNFGRDSMFSWAFHSSTLGSGETPTTADEAFVIKGGQDALTAHGDAVFLFAYLVTHPADLVGQNFLLTRLLGGVLGPWLANQIFAEFVGEARVGGYEAEIVTAGKEGDLIPQAINFVPTGPEISVLGNGVQLADGDTTASAEDGTDFGSTQQGQAAVTRTLTVRNDGGSPLTLAALVLPTGFSLVGPFPTSVPPSESVSFTVRLDTAASGVFSGKISFDCNDSDESPFDFAITGTVVPKPNEPPKLRVVETTNLTLQIEGPAGVAYSVEFTESLGENAVWRVVATVNAGETWAPTAVMEQGYFRVVAP